MHRPHPEKVRGTLVDLVLEIPRLLHHGVIPPEHIVNAVLETGGGDAGMSPGVSWTSFALTSEEYVTLTEELLTVPTARPREERKRWYPEKLIIDTSFSWCKNFNQWLQAVEGKYGCREKPFHP